MDKQSLVLYFMSLLLMTTALKIRQILVPQTVILSPHDNDTDDGVILDCDYDTENDTSDLVVKWFLNEQPVYQWIQPKAPQDMGALKGRLDLSYRASRHELTQFRAMRIKHVDRDLAGVYKCVVWNFKVEEEMSKRMVVVNKPTKLEMLQLDSDADDTVSIACSAYEVYPEPNVNISSSGSDEYENIDNQSIEGEDGLYNVTQIVTLRGEMLENITDFTCELTIPDTDFFRQRKLTFVPGSGTTEPQPEMSDYNAPISQSTYTKDTATSLVPMWLLMFAVTIPTLLST